jgi:hypothetical protein
MGAAKPAGDLEGGSKKKKKKESQKGDLIH